MSNLPWTPRARMIGELLAAVATVAVIWVLFVGTWFALANPVGATGAVGVSGTNGTNGLDGTNGLEGAKGDTGATGKQGTAGTNGTNGTNASNDLAPQANQYAAGHVSVSRGTQDATRWATYSTVLGSPYGDSSSGSFRFTCRTAPCAVSFQAETTATSASVYPKITIYKQAIGGGPMVYCEFADGSGTSDYYQTVSQTLNSLSVNIGSTLDCGSEQIQPADGNVSSIVVPAGYYDVFSTFTFKQ